MVPLELICPQLLLLAREHLERGGHRANRAGEIAEAERAKEKPGGQPEDDEADRRAPFEVQHRLLQQQAKRHVNAGRGAGLLVAEPVQVVPIAGKRAGHLDRVGADRAQRAVVGEQNQRRVEAVPKQEAEARSEKEAVPKSQELLSKVTRPSLVKRYGNKERLKDMAKLQADGVGMRNKNFEKTYNQRWDLFDSKNVSRQKSYVSRTWFRENTDKFLDPRKGEVV